MYAVKTQWFFNLYNLKALQQILPLCIIKYAYLSWKKFLTNVLLSKCIFLHPFPDIFLTLFTTFTPYWLSTLVIPDAFSRIPEWDSPPQCVDPVPPDSGGHRWQGHQSITHLQINHRGLRHRNILTFPWWLVLLTSVTRSYMQLKSVVFIGIKFLHSQTVT